MHVCVDYPPPRPIYCIFVFHELSLTPSFFRSDIDLLCYLQTQEEKREVCDLHGFFSPRTVWSLTIPGDSFGLRNAENKHIFQDLDALAIAMSLKCLLRIGDRCWLSEGPPTKHFGKLFSASQWPVAGQPLLSACSRPPTGSRRTIQTLETGL